jgi:hypothetical protein
MHQITNDITYHVNLDDELKTRKRWRRLMINTKFNNKPQGQRDLKAYPNYIYTDKQIILKGSWDTEFSVNCCLYKHSTAIKCNNSKINK